MSYVNTYDIDGVIYLGEELEGVRPGPMDIIITGRSFEEKNATYRMLIERGIFNTVYFNPLPFTSKTRESSAEHKAKTIREKLGDRHGIHFEDDPVQAMIIRRAGFRVIEIKSAGYVELENVWSGCDRPSFGWWCSREKGHEGPCAARKG